MVRDFFHAPVGDPDFLFLAAAIVGSVFNPWMIYYQQAATARRKIAPEEFGAVRADTAAGAVLTQALTGAVLVAAAAALYAGDRGRSLASIGEVGEALIGVLGRDNALLVYSLGVLGASFAAAIVASLALSWGVAEVFSRPGGKSHGAEAGLFDSQRFMALYVVSVGAAAALVASLARSGLAEHRDPGRQRLAVPADRRPADRPCGQGAGAAAAPARTALRIDGFSRRERGRDRRGRRGGGLFLTMVKAGNFFADVPDASGG